MADPTPPSVRPIEDRLNDRLDSWKEIATYLSRDVTTVQRWEKREGMPVHRHLHDRMGSVYASRAELDVWVRGRNLRVAQENGNHATVDDTPAQLPPTVIASPGKAPTPPPSDAGRALVAQAGVVPGSGSSTRKLRWPLLGVCLILTAIIGLWIRHRLPYDSPTHRVTEQRVTSNSPDAPVERAVVSPDGKYLAYTDPTGLYLRVIASGETRRWDVPKDFIAYPNSWFPDGTHLLVVRMEGMQPAPSLWKLSLLGATPRKLMDNAGPGSVSPDGTRIAFLTFLPDRGSQLWVMSADGSNPHKIAEASQPEGPGYPSGSILSPAWSPNSRRIACVEQRSDNAVLAPLAALSSLWTRDADGGDLQVILQDTLLGSALAWGPDGRILFASRANTARERDDEEIHSIRVDERTGKATAEPQLVSSGMGTIGVMSETLDGKRLVLSRNNTHEQAFISQFDSNARKWKTPERLTLDANGNMATAWLSDRTILFVSNRNGTWTLYKQAIDETTADVVVEGHSIFLPRLSADGSQVLYLSQTDPAHPSVPISLMRMPVAGGPSQVVLRDVSLGNYQCARLPSTLCIVTKLEKDDVHFFSFDPERGIGPELLKISGRVHDWSLSPDGRTLAEFPHGHSIRFFSVKNGAAREVKTVTLNEWPIDNGDWNADGSGLLIPSMSPDGTPVILEVDRAGKASVILEGAANTPFEFMVQSPDGHHGILGEIVPGDNNAWMIDNF